MAKKTLKEKCDERGMNYKTVTARIRRGWSEKDALNTPVTKPEPKADLPKVEMSQDIKKPADLDKYEDGFVITMSVILLGVAIVGILWLLLK